VHDAIMREEREDVADGTVLKEFRRGFRLGAQLLRPAMVQVRWLLHGRIGAVTMHTILSASSLAGWCLLGCCRIAVCMLRPCHMLSSTVEKLCASCDW
jgi:hypothetical protein